MRSFRKNLSKQDLKFWAESLARIVHHLDLFITASHGEDRSAFKTDLLKYRALLVQARCLSDRIQQALNNAN